MVYKKVAIYLRKSRMDGTDENIEETLARHERMLLDFCKRNNLLVVKTYKEVVTGDSIEGRPQMQQLLEDVEDGLYEGVVVIELERLSRGNPLDQYVVADTFKKSKTLIYTLAKTYNLSSEDEFDEEFFEFGLFMSRREYKTIRRRLLRGKKQAQKEGYFIGTHLPFGFDKKREGKGCVLIPNAQSEIIKLIFNKYVYEDLSPSEITHYLNSNGFKTKLGALFDKSTVRKILRNKVYAGYINTNVYNSMAYVVHYKGKHEPLIDMETWNKAQEKIKINTPRVKVDHTLTNPLASVIFCSKCGRSMQRRDGYLKCIQYGCTTSSANFNKVEERILLELRNELANFNYFLENEYKVIKDENQNREKEIKLLNKEITKKESMINKCCEMLEEGIYSKEKYLERVNILEQEISSLKANLELLLTMPNSKADNIKNAIPILEYVLDEYFELDTVQKNKLLKSIIYKVEYSKEKIREPFELKIHLKI